MDDNDVEMGSPNKILDKGKGKARDDDIVNPEPDPDVKELFDDPAMTVREFFRYMGDMIKNGKTSKPRLQRDRLAKREKDLSQSSIQIEGRFQCPSATRPILVAQ